MAAKKKTVLQPEVNIGLFGHVDHGKTSLVRALSGKWTDTHSEELKRGITIRLGYADAIVYKKKKADKAAPFTTDKEAGDKIERAISFVDAPGHESLMATMLAGATIIDGALLLISANEECPQPQTREHLMALQILGVKNLIVVQNKVDLVDAEKAKKNHDQVRNFLKGTDYEKVPIVPISAQHNINVDLLVSLIQEIMPTPKRNPKADPVMFVARSFDINKPGADPEKLLGGILGGSVKQGIFKKGQEIEILPGYEKEERNQKVWRPLTTKIVGCMTGGEPVDEIHPGGSVALLTTLDPSIVKSDRLAGAVVGLPGKLPELRYSITLEANLLDFVVGSKEEIKVDSIKKGEILMLNVNSSATVGVVTEATKKGVNCKLKRPISAENGARLTISRRVGNRFRLIGFGILKN